MQRPSQAGHMSHTCSSRSHVTHLQQQVTCHTRAAAKGKRQRNGCHQHQGMQAEAHTDTHTRHVAQAVGALVQAQVKRRQASTAAAASFPPLCRPQHLAQT